MNGKYMMNNMSINNRISKANVAYAFGENKLKNIRA